MNHNSQGLKASQVIEGFLQAKAAEALSPNTLISYQSTLAHWLSYLGDVPINEVKAQNLRAFFAYLRTEYTPRRLSGRTEPLSPKTIRNVYITLSSLFSWLQREFGGDNPMKTIPSPDYAVAEVEPFTQAELEALLKAVDYCEPAETHGRQSFTMRRRTALRDRALLLFLLDTGLRVSELCALNIGDVDQKSGKVTVKHGAEGGAKGGKGRLVYLGKSARRVLWRYRVTREDSHEADAPLFLAGHRRLRRDALRQLTASLGEKAQVKDCHPHRFRHTFAITFLRSGGDVSLCNRYSVTPHWKWFSTTRELLKSMSSRLIAGLARRTTGGCNLRVHS